MTFKSRSGLKIDAKGMLFRISGAYESLATATSNVIETTLAGKVDIISVSSPRVNGAGRANIRLGGGNTSGSFWTFNSGQALDMFCYLDRNYGYSGIALDILFNVSGCVGSGSGQVTWETDIQRMSVGNQLGTGAYSYKQTNINIGTGTAHSDTLNQGTIIFRDTEMNGWKRDEYAFIRLKRGDKDSITGEIPLWSYSARENLYSGISQ